MNSLLYYYNNVQKMAAYRQAKRMHILRVGADFRLKCLGCEHQVMVSRKLVEKNTRGLRKKGE